MIKPPFSSGLTIALCFFMGAILGCEDVVVVDLPEGPTRLIIDGRIERLRDSPTGNQEIRLTTTDDFYGAGAPPPATGAVVTVTDDLGNSVAFEETTPGVYRTSDLVPDVGRTYTLRIEYDGEMYEGSETLHAVPPIDRAYAQFFESTAFDDEGIRLVVDFTDPAGVVNFYYWEQLRNGELVAIEPDPGVRFTLLSDDTFYDGGQVVGKRPSDIIYESGDTAVVRQIALSEATYDYLRSLFGLFGGSGGFLQPPPATLKGNVRNLTRPEHYPLGYFSAGEVDVETFVVSDSVAAQ